ncbi:MAG: helix-turn-helix transcriptional regulator [Pseudolysinimonas sp.]
MSALDVMTTWVSAAPPDLLRRRAERLRLIAARLDLLAQEGGGSDAVAPWWEVLSAGCEGLALDHADEEETRDGRGTPAAHALPAVVDALHGRADAVRGHLAVMTHDPHLRGATAVTRAMLAAALGDNRVAVDGLLTLLGRPSQSLAEGELATVGLLAELSWSTSARGNARDLVERLGPRLAEAGDVTQAEWAFADVLLCSDDSERGLERLLARENGSVFRQMRLELALGMLQRRSRRPRSSRAHLQEAFEAATALGAVAWVARSQGELRAAGGRLARDEPSALGMLSVQELRIAQLAAQGLSNTGIASELSLSPRTVGSHLYRIFPKLAISSRVELAALVLRAG